MNKTTLFAYLWAATITFAVFPFWALLLLGYILMAFYTLKVFKRAYALDFPYLSKYEEKGYDPCFVFFCSIFWFIVYLISDNAFSVVKKDILELTGGRKLVFSWPIKVVQETKVKQNKTK